MPSDIKVAVVTGQHPFDLISFHQALRSMDRVDAYVQHMEDFAASPAETRDSYDVVLFYNFHQATPTGEEPGWFEKPVKSALEHLGSTKQGILVLHHALLAFPHWPVWTHLTGLKDRSRFTYDVGQKIRVDIAAPEHPIVNGLDPWEMIEETYRVEDTLDHSTVLLTTQHPQSMRKLAWVRQYRNSPVFCLQLGHDDHAYSHPSFRRVLQRGMTWLANSH